MSEPMHVHGRFGMTWGGHRAGVTFVITDPMTQGDTGRVIEVEADCLAAALRSPPARSRTQSRGGTMMANRWARQDYRRRRSQRRRTWLPEADTRARAPLLQEPRHRGTCGTARHGSPLSIQLLESVAKTSGKPASARWSSG